jgi:PTS system mannose-specific IID component
MSAAAASSRAPVVVPAPRLPLLTRLAIFVRLLAVQGAWNYEILLGNGIGFCLEPALRRLPGGIDGPAYRSALARESRYFNAHPYLAAVAVGALARAELDLEKPERIERFRTALAISASACGDFRPDGSTGSASPRRSAIPCCGAGPNRSPAPVRSPPVLPFRWPSSA